MCVENDCANDFNYLACYAVRAIKPCTSQDTLKTVYHSCVHSLMKYVVIFWGNSFYSNNIFGLQKSIIRIITVSRSRDCCRELFTNLQSYPFNHKISFHSYYVWLEIGIYIRQTRKFMALIIDKALTSVIRYKSRQLIKSEHTTLVSRSLTLIFHI
jgi:hypothetical protein